jgi:hypothetical protein
MDRATIERHLDVRGGLNVGMPGAMINGELSVMGTRRSWVAGSLAIGPHPTYVYEAEDSTHTEYAVFPVETLDVSGEGCFRVNDYHSIVLKSPNSGNDEDGYIDFVKQRRIVDPIVA